MALPPPPSQPYQWTFRHVMWSTLVLIFVALCFWLLYRFYQVVFILFFTIVMGTVIRPIVTWLHRRGLPRIAGVILVYLLLLALLAGFLLLLFPLIVEQGSTIAAAVPGYYQSLRAWMGNYPNQLIVRLSEFLPAVLPGLEPLQQTAEQMLAFCRASVGLRGSVGQGHLYDHCYSAIDPSLDARWSTRHTVIVAAGTKEPT